MNSEQLQALLTARVAPPGRMPPCPDLHQVAGYVDGALPASERDELERHLADCGHCLDLVGLLAGDAVVLDAEPAQPRVARTAGAGSPTIAPRRWQWTSRVATAAALILAVPLLLQVAREVVPGHRDTGPVTMPRTATAVQTGLRVLTPAAGSTIDGRHVAFRWSEVAGSPYYDVRVLTDTGDVVASQRITGTNWQLPASVKLQSGAEYFVHVEAYPTGDKAVKSTHVPFRVAD